MTAPVPTPSWYDLLGVAPDAPAEEVRAAWRAQIADLDPTDRRFAVLNQAAEVLLDPSRRAAYDAELAPREDQQPVELPEVQAEDQGEDRADEQPEEQPDVRPDEALPAAAPDVADPGGRIAAIPGWLLAVTAALTLALVATAVVLWTREPSAGDVEGDARAAQAAAERAVVPILSYDATHLDESKAAAQQYLTGKLRGDYDKIFTGLIEKNAPSTKTVVTASLVRSSIVRADEGHAQIFLLVNQARTNKLYKEPQVYKNWVTLTMDKVDGDWLVADMTT